jgi:apolipoprotein N-acyltransferase
VSLLQGNIEQSLKWRPELLERSLETYLRLAREYPAELVLLPETALPTTLDALPSGYLKSLKEAAASKAGDILLGIVTRDQSGGYFNSAVGLGPGTTQSYSKSHLVPFGEFTPRFLEWTMSLMHIPMSNFGRGAGDQPPLALAGERIAVNICYEDVFGEEIIRALPAATLLINLSNTAWFGNSLAQPQHLQIAQLRALETGRVMLRATNTGMTAAVSPEGRVIARLEPFSVGALQVVVRGRSGSTPYARWGNAGILVLALTSLAPGLFIAVRANWP